MKDRAMLATLVLSVCACVHPEPPTAPAPIDPFQIARHATVRISGTGGMGSGAAIGPDLIVTAGHVLAGAVDWEIDTIDGQLCETDAVWLSSGPDLALVQVSGCTLDPLELSGQELRIGDRVVAAGHPLGLYWTAVEGTIAGLNRSLFGQDVLQLEAAVNQGMSGGPVVDELGRLVGIATGISSDTSMYAGIAFAVPVDQIRTMAEKARSP